MKLLIFFFLLLFTVVHAQTIQNNQIIMGHVDSVQSKILNEKRKIWVYIPASANESTVTKAKYPVVYLLDGEAHFPSLTGIVQQLSTVNGNTVLPEMIVVGIINTDRTRDLTPTNSLTEPDGKRNEGFKSSGGGEQFISFVEKELMPRVDSLYPTAPYKVLIGHSFGALTAINVLINHPQLFNAYIAIEPSMWWDQQKLLKQAKAALRQKSYSGKKLFLAIANTMSAGMDTLQARKDTNGNTVHIRSILALNDVLKRSSSNGLTYSYSYYKNDNHSSVPLIAEYDALRFLFGFYSLAPNQSAELYNPATKANVSAILAARYQELSNQFGYQVLPPEGMVNELAYYHLQKGGADNAYALFALNIKNYPTSANAFDSMGDYYSFKKDRKKAIEYYTKTLKLFDNPDTREKLKQLQNEK